MEITLKYINYHYATFIKGYDYIPPNKVLKFKRGDILKTIDKYSLKELLSGKLYYIDPYFRFFKIYNIFNKKSYCISPNQYHIFCKVQPDINLEFSKSLENIINNLPKKNTVINKN